MLYNEFSNTDKLTIATGDLETLQFTDGKILNDDELFAFYKQVNENGDLIHNISFAREHTKTRAWAWLIGNDEKFAICENFDEYCVFCKNHNVKQIWFYNAKFDFAFFDYALLTNNFMCAENPKELKNTPFSYNSLHDAYGQRYKLSINYDGHVFTMVDFCNFFGVYSYKKY